MPSQNTEKENLEALTRLAQPKITRYKNLLSLTEYAQNIAANDIDCITDNILTRLKIKSNEYVSIESMYMYVALEYYHDALLLGMKNKVKQLNFGEIEYFSCYIINKLR